jgi:hypothetical protein
MKLLSSHRSKGEEDRIDGMDGIISNLFIGQKEETSLLVMPGKMDWDKIVV